MSDYISRKELLKHQYRIDDSATLSTRDVVNVEDIENATSADVISIDQANAMIKSYVSHYEENKGEWILAYRDCGVEFYYCSKCNLGRAVIDGSYYKSLDEFKKCPNCGADIRGKDE